MSAPAKTAGTAWLKIWGLPRSTMPSDLRRILRAAKVENVSDIKLDYKGFLPTGNAYIAFPSPEQLPQARKALQNNSHMTVPFRISTPARDPLYQSVITPEGSSRPRVRGNEGLAEAAERGILTGKGPGAGMNPRGRDVVIWGLPGQLGTKSLWEYLQKSGLVGVDERGVPQGKVFKIYKQLKTPSITSRHVVRLPNVFAAHQLVRQLHFTYFGEETYGRKYLIRAQIIH